MRFHDRLILLSTLVLCFGGLNSANAYGVLYAQRIGGGQSGGFLETYCTGLLPQTSYVQPLQVFEASDSFGRSGTMTNEASVSLGSISMRNSGAFSNEIVNALYAGSVINNFPCSGGLRPDVTQWNDTMTITGSGTFALTVELDSKVEGSPLRPNGTAANGIDNFSNVEARLGLYNQSGGSILQLIVNDAMDDGDQGFQHRSQTFMFNGTAGQLIDLAGSMEITLLFGALLGTLSWDIDAGSTANFYIDPISPGAAYTTTSGVSYLSTTIPLPATTWLLLSALSLLGGMRCKRS